MRRALALLAVIAGFLVLLICVYAGNIALGMHVRPQTSGTISGLALRAPVEIIRDARDIPHIRARNEHDLFFAEGYVEATDRLFQLDLSRRFVLGDLSEILGKAALAADEDARTIPVRSIVQRQWERLDPHDRALLQAFTEGINAAMTRGPTPPEFRLLMYRPKPWTPQDSLVLGMATVIDLTDTWDDIAGRHGNPLLTDPCYEAPVTAGLQHVAPVSNACTHTRSIAAALRPWREPIGSNEWASGSAHTTTGRALLANDPHLRLGIPGVWYLVDLQAPGYHAAGATLAGTPGVILGHNDHIAWGATNGTVTSLSAFKPPAHLPAADWQSETFHVRFGADVTRRYYRGRHLFGATVDKNRLVLVRWNFYDDPQTSLSTFDRLDRARSIEDGLQALRDYPGPTQNFVLADTRGRAAYELAGFIPNDPVWARSIHPASDLARVYPAIPFERLPKVAASRDAIVWTSNNKMYGAGYPYRLSPQFAPPYRAYRVAELLRARSKYSVAYFASMQMDTLSLAEHEMAEDLVQSGTPNNAEPSLASALHLLAGWNGEFTPSSRAASLIEAYRVASLKAMKASLDEVLNRDRHAGLHGAYAAASNETRLSQLLTKAPELLDTTWSVAGATTVRHPLAALGLSFFNGSTFAGNGDAYTVHVQNQGFSQSFRAVWDIGNWDAGGITIPQGESGWPGSGHYTDEASAWIAGRLLPLPYSNAAVDRAAVEYLRLEP